MKSEYDFSNMKAERNPYAAKMSLNHLIVGAADVQKSASFYCDLFGFKKVSDDPGMIGGQVLEGDGCDLLILPFDGKPLPNPVHFAFEVNSIAGFEKAIELAKQMGLEPRSEPSRNSKLGHGEFKRGSKAFKNFYVSDPSGTNVELMVFI